MYKIDMPDNLESICRLQRKYVEYKERFERFSETPEEKADAICKMELVSKILLEGFVAPAEMMLELEKKYVDIFDRQLFLDKLSNAWGVIEDYVKTGGKNLVGGTDF